MKRAAAFQVLCPGETHLSDEHEDYGSRLQKTISDSSWCCYRYTENTSGPTLKNEKTLIICIYKQYLH